MKRQKIVITDIAALEAAYPDAVKIVSAKKADFKKVRALLRGAKLFDKVIPGAHFEVEAAETKIAETAESKAVADTTKAEPKAEVKKEAPKSEAKPAAKASPFAKKSA